VTRRLPPRIRAIVDKTQPVCREMYRRVAEMMSAIDDFDGYARVMGPRVDEYWHDYHAALAELVARDMEDMPCT